MTKQEVREKVSGFLDELDIIETCLLEGATSDKEFQEITQAFSYAIDDIKDGCETILKIAR